MKTQPTILEAMSDPTIFGKWFAPKKRWFGKRDTWANWRIFLAVIFGLPLNAEQLAIVKRFTGRDDMPAEGFKEIYAICGRRAGKSLIAALIAVYVSCFIDHSAVLMPGESGVYMIVASDKRQARVILGYVTAFLTGVPLLKKLIKAVLKESVELTNGITIEIHTADFRAVRGYSCIGINCDETSFWTSDTNGISPDVEILNAVRPSLATTGGLLLCISSPWARHGVMFDAYKNYYGKSGSPAIAWKASSRDMNETIPQATVLAAYARDFTSAKTEWGGEFRTDIEGFLSLEAVESCIVSGRLELPRIAGVSYSAFCDPAGGTGQDSFTIAIAHAITHGENEIAVLDVLREIHPPFSAAQVVQEFATLLKSYGISSVSGDRYASGFNAELWTNAGVQYEPSDKTRSQLYLEVLPMLTSGKVQLLDLPKLKSQLLGLERKVGRNQDLVDHGPNQHDDCANSACGALTLVATGGDQWALLTMANTPGAWQKIQEQFAAEWNYLKTDVFGKRSENPRMDNLDKKAMYEFEKKLRGVDETTLNPVNAEFWKPPQPPPCPQCGETKCLIWLGPDGCKCNSCGKQWPPSGKWQEVTVATRSGLATVRKRVY